MEPVNESDDAGNPLVNPYAPPAAPPTASDEDGAATNRGKSRKAGYGYVYTYAVLELVSIGCLVGSSGTERGIRQHDIEPLASRCLVDRVAEDDMWLYLM